MKQWPVLLFAALLAVCGFLVLSTTGDLPEKVAIHFTAGGLPDNWTTRDHYRLVVLLFLVGLPLLLIWAMAGLPLLTGGQGQIPNHEYWFAQERRRSTASFLLRHACWLGCLTVAVIYGLHVLIVRANAVEPPLLATDRLLTTVLVYFVGIGWWFTSFIRHFQRMEG
jgi:hypothetical protein